MFFVPVVLVVLVALGAHDEPVVPVVPGHMPTRQGGRFQPSDRTQHDEPVCALCARCACCACCAVYA